MGQDRIRSCWAAGGGVGDGGVIDLTRYSFSSDSDFGVFSSLNKLSKQTSYPIIIKQSLTTMPDPVKKNIPYTNPSLSVFLSHIKKRDFSLLPHARRSRSGVVQEVLTSVPITNTTSSSSSSSSSSPSSYSSPSSPFPCC